MVDDTPEGLPERVSAFEIIAHLHFHVVSESVLIQYMRIRSITT
jgi:hypothetical protein